GRAFWGRAPVGRRFLLFAARCPRRRSPALPPPQKKAIYPPGWRPARANAACCDQSLGVAPSESQMKTILEPMRAWATDSMFRPSSSKKTKNQKHVTTPLIYLCLPVDCVATEHTSSPLRRRSSFLVDGGIDFGGRYSNRPEVLWEIENMDNSD